VSLENRADETELNVKETPLSKLDSLYGKLSAIYLVAGQRTLKATPFSADLMKWA
jgi:hypothetical protein